MVRWVSKVATVLILALPAYAQSTPATRKPATNAAAVKKSAKPQAASKQTPPPPPAPITPMTPEQMPPSPPQVSYLNGQLTILAENATLSDILNAVRARTGAQVEIPPAAASERVAANLGPGPARAVINSLLTGSRFDYMIVGSSSAPGAVSKLIVTPRQAMPVAANGGGMQYTPPPDSSDFGDEEQQADIPDRAPMNEPPPPTQPPPAEMQRGQTQSAEQPQPSSDQQNAPTPASGNQQGTGNQGVKTPEQLLQEIQRMEQQRQQQQKPPR